MKERNSNIELLRLICIVMIVSMHVFGLYKEQLGMAGLLALSFNNAVCNLGVSIFMLISGFYGIKYKTERLFALWNIALFWSIVLLFVDTDHSVKNIVRSIFPVFTGKYWFLTAYIVISFLSPYIEKLINVIDVRHFQRLIGILILFFIIAPSLLMFEIMNDSGKGIVNMLLVYLLGRYFAIYGFPKWLIGLKSFLILFPIILIVAGIDFIVSQHFDITFQMLARDNCILILLGAIIVFCLVLQMKPRSVRWINQLATYVFPIYIIHYVLLYHIVYIPMDTYSMLYLMVWINAIVVAVVAVMMEFIRRKFFSNVFNKLLRAELMIIEKIKIII